MVKRDVSHKFVVDSFQFKLPKPFQGLYPHFKWSFDPWYSMFTPSLLGRGGDLSHTIVPLVHSTWSFTPYKFVADKYQKCRSRLIWGNFWDFYVGWMRGMVICEISLSLSLWTFTNPCQSQQREGVIIYKRTSHPSNLNPYKFVIGSSQITSSKLNRGLWN